MPYVGFMDGGTSALEFEDQKKDFNLFSNKFNSNQSLKNFSQNLDITSKKKKDENDDDDLDEMLKNMPKNRTDVSLFNFTLVWDLRPMAPPWP